MLKHPFIAAFFFLGLIGILVATQQVQIPQIFLPKANVLGVTLSILPANTSLEVGREASFDINLNPEDEAVSAVELILNFDQNVIEVVNIKPTEALPQILGLDLTKPGRASAILLVNPGSTKTAQGVIARVFIKAKKAGSTSLKFDQSTKVSAIGKSGDVIGANEGSQIEVLENSSANSPVQSSAPSQPADTSQADALIKQYLSLDEAVSESSKSGGVINFASDFIQNIVKNINISVEDQARKWLD